MEAYCCEFHFSYKYVRLASEDDKNTSSPSLRADIFLGGRLLVAGAPVADWGGVSTWGQEGLSCHPPPAGQPDLELGDLHHLHVGFLVYLHL